jgi:hypothetical protein
MVLPSLCLPPAGKTHLREELPLFGYLFPAAQAGKRGGLPARSRFGEGRGEISQRLCRFYFETINDSYLAYSVGRLKFRTRAQSLHFLSCPMDG